MAPAKNWIFTEVIETSTANYSKLYQCSQLTTWVPNTPQNLTIGYIVIEISINQGDDYPLMVNHIHRSSRATLRSRNSPARICDPNTFGPVCPHALLVYHETCWYIRFGLPIEAFHLCFHHWSKSLAHSELKPLTHWSARPLSGEGGRWTWQLEWMKSTSELESYAYTSGCLPRGS